MSRTDTDKADQTMAEADGPDLLTEQVRTIFGRAAVILGVDELSLSCTPAWAAVVETLLCLKGEFSLKDAAQRCVQVYIEEAAEPADARLADAAYAPCWQAVVLYIHGALQTDSSDRGLVPERVEEFVQQRRGGRV